MDEFGRDRPITDRLGVPEVVGYRHDHGGGGKSSLFSSLGIIRRGQTD